MEEKEKTNNVDKNGQRTGLWRFLYFHDAVMGEGLYVKDRRVGLWTWYMKTDGLTNEISEEEIYI